MDKYNNKAVLDVILKKLSVCISLPKGYEKFSDNRYKNLADFLTKECSLFNGHDLYVTPQGSFRLGTVVNPLPSSLSSNNEYDLDMIISVNDLSVNDISPMELRDMIKNGVVLYCKSRGFSTNLQEKSRCFRISYKENKNIPFHMDIVPAIPQSHNETDKSLFTTDNQKLSNWIPGNPLGFAEWFSLKCRLYKGCLACCEDHSIDAVPRLDNANSNLQVAIRLIKRHRDKYYHVVNKENLTIPSIVLSVKAARAYTGTGNLYEDLCQITSYLVNKPFDECNPVLQVESYTDRCSTEMRDEFKRWAVNLKKDIEALECCRSRDELNALLYRSFDETICLSESYVHNNLETYRVNSIYDEPRPWCDND